MFDVKPGLLEGSTCLMLSLGSWRGRMFDVRPGPWTGQKV